MGAVYDWDEEQDFEEDWNWWEDERIRQHTEREEEENNKKEFEEIMENAFPSDSKERMILELEAKKLGGK
jgi:hypothetical protein